MDSLLFNLFGLGFTAILSIYLEVRKKKYPGKITLIKDNSVGLFSELANNFEEIKIQFKDNPIQKNIIYVKGTLINNGRKDLNLLESEVPIGLHLNKDLNWIKSKITKSSENLNCSSMISNKQILVFECGYLRIGEFFQFEALIETNNSNYNSSNIFAEIEPKHRILNTQGIKVTSYLSEEERKTKKLRVRITYFFLTLVTLMFLYGAASRTYFTANTKFEYLHSGKLFEATPLTDNTVQLVNIETADEKVIAVQEFYENYYPIIPKRNFWENLEQTLYGFYAIMFFYIIMSIGDMIKLRRTNQIVNILGKRRT